MKKGERRQFCLRGHDTLLCGRYKYRQCKLCVLKIEKQKCGNKLGIPLKQFCKYGHDISIVGRDKWGACITCIKIYWQKNKERIKELRKNSSIKLKRYWKQYKNPNPEKKKIATAKRRATLKKSAVKWGQEEIIDFYKNIPKNMTVDHIIPLSHNKIRGLHVIWNLQYLSLSKNCSKKNKINLLQASKWYGKILERARLK